MENPKDRGRKHLKNKNKYKDKSKYATVQPTTKPRRLVLDSNWDRYDNNEEDNLPDTGTDFTLLANNPITCGSHFQFKNDKNQSFINEIEDNKTLNVSKIFNLDLNLLNRSISCIPFNERSGISDSNFTEIQKENTYKKERDNQKSYMEYIANYKENVLFMKDADDKETVMMPSTEATVIDADIAITNTLLDISQNLDLLNISEQSESKNSVNQSGDKNDSDLEKWLDDILDT